MKYAMICETPYQLFNILNFTYTETHDDDEIDLYINTVNTGMQLFYNNVNAVGKFRAVIEYSSPQKKLGRLKYYYRRFLEYFFPYTALNISMNNKVSKVVNKYDTILFAFPNPLIVDFCSVYSKADIWFIEDGTGSYHGKIGTATSTKISKLLNHFLHRGAEYIHPSRLYVYKPELCKTEYSNVEIRKLNAISHDSSKYVYVERVFGSEIDSKAAQIIYISQPIRIGNYLDKEKELLLSICECCSNMEIRVHPTDDDKKFRSLSRVLIDSGEYQWEVKCAKHITENTVLVGTCSTAQLTPKMLYDIEPYLVFTIELYSDDLPVEVIERLKKLICDVKCLYKNSNKVIIPKTKEELIETLKLIEFR